MLTEIRQMEDSYEITLKIQGMKENNIDVQIDRNGILFSGDYSHIVEKRDMQGKITSIDEVHRTISKKFPIPRDVDFEKSQVIKSRDEITITFPKSDS